MMLFDYEFMNSVYSLKEVFVVAVPKRRTSKKVKNQRRTHKKLHVPGLVECTNCSELTKPHHVCKECGHYDGNEVVEN